ncbi:hypothetical protein U1Q18_039046 [Sarracenia purpurea var. burkii]
MSIRFAASAGCYGLHQLSLSYCFGLSLGALFLVAIAFYGYCYILPFQCQCRSCHGIRVIILSMIVEKGLGLCCCWGAVVAFADMACGLPLWMPCNQWGMVPYNVA